MIGRTLEHYRIEAKLGEGGMGVVYRAHDSRLNRPVAIKVLPPEKVADPAGKQRFVQEAKAASALNHPGIVTIHDIRSDAGIDFIVMEYIEGKTLEELIPAKGMQAAEVLRLAVQIAEALAKAHGAGILHRDLKPSNLMVTADGRIKILDFGLAKLLETPGQEHSSGATTFAPLTEEHVLLGTAAYMSPEQAEGRKLDARSDIFSFGAVLYQMATGRRPFAGDSRLSILTKILNEDPKAPSELAASIPPELEKTILRCLRKDPERRYQTTADLRVALEDLAFETASGAMRRSRRAPSRWRWAWAALLPIALAAGYAGWRTWRPAQPDEPLRANALTTFPGKELYPSFSPDGGHVAFTWTGPRQDNTDIYVQQIGAGAPLRLTTDPRSDYNPAWSPDGRSIAFLRGDPASPLGTSDRELRLIAPLGGPERKLADVRVREMTINPVYLDWCPDSRCLVVTDTTGVAKPDALFVISVETGEKRQLTNPQPPALADTNPARSPDGESLLFLRRATWAMGELHVLPLGNGVTAAGEVRRIPVPRLNPDNATWLPNGNELLFSTSALAGSVNLWRLPATGDAQPARLPFVGEDGIMPAVSRAQPGRPARLVYVRSFIDENIWRINTPAAGAAAASPPAVAIASTKADIHPQLSPDGTRVAFTSTRAGPWEIWVSDLDGANAVQITFLRAPTGTGVPRWSPDGRWITFASDAEGQFEIFVIPSEGGKPRRLTSHAAFDHVPSFSRDGKWIYFCSDRTGQYQVWKVPAPGGDAVQVTTDGGGISYESPDGAYLYYTSTMALASRPPLWRVPTSGGPPLRVVDGLTDLAPPLERGIYYIDGRAGEGRLQFFDFATSKSTTVARLDDLGELGSAGVSASRDGRIILYGRRDTAVDDLMLVENIR